MKDSARVLDERALEMADSQDNSTDTSVARLLFELGNLYHDHAKAASYFRRAMGIRQKVLGSQDVETICAFASALNAEGIVQLYRGMYVAADSLFLQALAMREHALDSGHVEVGWDLMCLANANWGLGRFIKAEELFKRALTIWRVSHQPVDDLIGTGLLNLGNIYAEMCRYAEAEELYKKSLTTFENSVGPHDPENAFPLHNLAILYMNIGKIGSAELLLKREIDTLENPFGAYGLRQLATCLDLQNRYREAEAVERQALEGTRQTMGAGHPEVAQRLAEIALLCSKQGKPAEADSLFRAAFDIVQQQKQTNDLDVEFTISSTAGIFAVAGKLADAESLYEHAITILKRTGVNEILDRQEIIPHMADVYMKQGKYHDASKMLVSALGTHEEVWGNDHPAVAFVLELLSRCARASSNSAGGLYDAFRAFGIRKRNLYDALFVLPERDALKYSEQFHKCGGNYFSCFFDARVQDEDAIRHAADVALSVKGQVSDVVLERGSSLVGDQDSTTIALSDAYRRTRFRLSRLYVLGPRANDNFDNVHTIDSLTRVSNDIEEELTRRSGGFKTMMERQTVTSQKVARLLPENTTLVEYLKYEHLGPGPDTATIRYLSIVVSGSGATSIKDLGEASAIEGAVSRYRSHLLRISEPGHVFSAEDNSEYQAVARQITRLVWAPIKQDIKRGTTLLVAPDGALNLVSFAGLIDRDGKYLIERHPIHYLSTGRDLIRLQEPSRSGSGLIAFGDPDYDASIDQRRRGETGVALNSPVHDYPYALRNIRSGCGALSEITVPPLPGTRTEVHDIENLWKSRHEPYVIYVGSQASEERFKQECIGKRVVHVATHGYFLQGECTSNVSTGHLVASPEDVFRGENPLLQSGFFLSGANLHGEGAEKAKAEDGIVTALEVSAMDLRGIDLVVLSACETGLGRVEQSEGVYGLRRAFQMAGARTVVSSLWRIPDEETMKFMKTLYLRKARTYPELMQQVMLQRIREARLRGRSTHPFTWGGFITTGDWRIH